MVMGHSLGEYGALMAAGVLTFEHTLEAVSARGREMSHLDVKDRGLMAAVIAPLDEIEAAVAGVDGCIIANFNSTNQAVIGGATPAVQTVMEKLTEAGRTVVPLPVSHAFHTSIVEPASEPLRAALTRLGRLRCRSCRTSPATCTRPVKGRCRRRSTFLRARSHHRCSSSPGCGRCIAKERAS
jgi:acyl transferase domain-containing protein